MAVTTVVVATVVAAGAVVAGAVVAGAVMAAATRRPRFLLAGLVSTQIKTLFASMLGHMGYEQTRDACEGAGGQGALTDYAAVDVVTWRCARSSVPVLSRVAFIHHALPLGS